ncbi:hypothetical protein H0H93_002672 [Arthromyces matolae]|nr:hypothetical protein H0H93_002672 [Arthromyces matolae]
MTTTPLHPLHYPSELQNVICACVYSFCLPPDEPSLDPLIQKDYGTPTALPSSLPGSSWPEPVARRTLANLCLVNHSWYEAAKPWLWAKVEVRLPITWLSLVEEVAWDYDEETVDQVMEKTIKVATQVAIQSSRSVSRHDDEKLLEESIIETLSIPDIPDESIPPELLSPAVSRDPSPRRLRPKSKSPARWKLIRSISDAIQNVFDKKEPGVYVPTPHDPRPGRFIRHIDFNHFRTIGMRRSVDEGVHSRFVTGDRVEAILKEMPNLEVFGATEYMDGALTLPVLKELFLRGAPSRGRGRPARGRGLVIDTHDNEEEDRERRRECRDLEAVDLTGCVSAVFVNALTEFVTMYLQPQADGEADDEDDPSERRDRRSRAVRFREEPLSIPGLQRLGLRGVKSIIPRILSPFILAFPSLTHLDLSGTRVTPDILIALSESPILRLRSLALARCVRLTSASIKTLLVDSLVTSDLEELNLYGDSTFATDLSESDLREIITKATCFTSGALVYLDLSSAPLTRDLLKMFHPQPKLRSLGFSHIPNLELKAITEFLKTTAPQVEILTLVSTAPELDCGLRPTPPGAPRGSARQSSVALHTQLIRPLCSPPFSFISSSAPTPAPPTNLRVVELSTALLSGLGAGAGAWRIVRSKGGRGWYVDTASGWVSQFGSGQGGVLRRDLEPEHPFRVEMEKLSKANGNVTSGVGWHARKMEILHGHGMLGREDGLYGAASFAHQG